MQIHYESNVGLPEFIAGCAMPLRHGCKDDSCANNQETVDEDSRAHWLVYQGRKWTGKTRSTHLFHKNLLPPHENPNAFPVKLSLATSLHCSLDVASGFSTITLHPELMVFNFAAATIGPLEDCVWILI